MSPSLVIYHQTHFDSNGKFQSILPLLDSFDGQPLVSRIIVAAMHLNEDETQERDFFVTLNDHRIGDGIFLPLWAELEVARAKGVQILLMVGGAAPGTIKALDYRCGSRKDGDLMFENAYQKLRAALRSPFVFDGMDLNVEEPMTESGFDRLLIRLRKDFPRPFIVTMAPMAPALQEGGRDLSMLNYEKIEITHFNSIDAYHVQFYNGWGNLTTADGFHRLPKAATDKREPNTDMRSRRHFLGILSSPLNGSSGFVAQEILDKTINDIIATYNDNFAGIVIWEYFRSGALHADEDSTENRIAWIKKLRKSLNV